LRQVTNDRADVGKDRRPLVQRGDRRIHEIAFVEPPGGEGAAHFPVHPHDILGSRARPSDAVEVGGGAVRQLAVGRDERLFRGGVRGDVPKEART
jgi:hypothetical protein